MGITLKSIPRPSLELAPKPLESAPRDVWSQHQNKESKKLLFFIHLNFQSLQKAYNNLQVKLNPNSKWHKKP